MIIAFATGNWDDRVPPDTGLTRFLDDGGNEIDANTVERLIRRIALNRKNVVFAGSEDGAESWAVLTADQAPARLLSCLHHRLRPG
jgi:hypothetical protein